MIECSSTKVKPCASGVTVTVVASPRRGARTATQRERSIGRSVRRKKTTTTHADDKVWMDSPCGGTIDSLAHALGVAARQT